MKFALGIIGIIAGVVLGLYVGLWVCFIGGILGLIGAIQVLVTTGTILYTVIGISVIKILLASFAGWVSAVILILPSFALIQSDLYKPFR